MVALLRRCGRIWEAGVALAGYPAGAAVTAALPAGKITMTIGLRVNDLAPAKSDTLIARAKAFQVGSTAGAAQGNLFTIIDGAEHACAVALVTLHAASISEGNEKPPA